MKVALTEAAKADLVGMGEYIRPHNPARAATFVDELLDRCDALAQDYRLPFLIRRLRFFRGPHRTEGAADTSSPRAGTSAERRIL